MSSFEQFQQVYQQALYVVLRPEMNLRIGVFHQELQDFLKDNNIHQWAMITAYNPGSTVCTETENKTRQDELAELLNEEGLRFLEAEHRDPKAQWPIEKSFFIERIDLKSALALGYQLGQNAIVAGDERAIPQLFDCTFKASSGD